VKENVGMAEKNQLDRDQRGEACCAALLVPNDDGNYDCEDAVAKGLGPALTMLNLQLTTK